MKNNFKLYLSLFLVPLFFYQTVISASTLPISNQATILDRSSSAEVVIKATGIFQSKKRFFAKRETRKYGNDFASKDARKAALNTLLFGGTDPLITSTEEINAFEKLKDSFFSDANINSFITYEEPHPSEKVLINNKKGVKITKIFKVNTNILEQYLETNNIRQRHLSLTDKIGNPTIMVIPKTPQNTNPVEFLSTNNNAQIGAGIIQSTLTAKQFNVILPDQQQFLKKLTESHTALSNISKDPAYELALLVGSDIYIDYSINHSKSAYDTDKYSITVRAFETTTGRLLGSETGHSLERKNEPYVSIEEAFLTPINNVLSRIYSYWKTDLEDGIQYKVITSIDIQNLTDSDIESIQDSYISTLTRVSKKKKEIVVTESTLDYVIWCDANKYESARNIWKKIRDSFKEKNPELTLSLINQNKKLILTKITRS